MMQSKWASLKEWGKEKWAGLSPAQKAGVSIGSIAAFYMFWIGLYVHCINTRAKRRKEAAEGVDASEYRTIDGEMSSYEGLIDLRIDPADPAGPAKPQAHFDERYGEHGAALWEHADRAPAPSSAAAAAPPSGAAAPAAKPLDLGGVAFAE